MLRITARAVDAAHADDVDTRVRAATAALPLLMAACDAVAPEDVAMLFWVEYGDAKVHVTALPEELEVTHSSCGTQAWLEQEPPWPASFETCVTLAAADWLCVLLDADDEDCEPDGDVYLSVWWHGAQVAELSTYVYAGETVCETFWLQ